MGFWKSLVLACNRNIESIDKSRCNLREVPPEVLRYAKTLLELNLEVNYIESLPNVSAEVDAYFFSGCYS